MSAVEIVTLIAMILVSGGVTSGLFQLVKDKIPESNGLRRICAWLVALVIALATSYLAGDVWGVIGSWGDGTLTAAAVFAYATAIWGAAEALYNLWYKTPASASAAAVNKLATKAVGDASSVIASVAASLTKDIGDAVARSETPTDTK